MARENELTDAQKNAYKENSAALDKAEEQLRMTQQEARARLKALGIDDGPTSCMSCGCPAYVVTPHHPGVACPREHCGHSWPSHQA